MLPGLSATTNWIITVCNIFALWSLALVLGYYLRKFCKKNNEMIIMKRYPELVLLINVCAIILVTIHRPLQIIYYVSPVSEISPTAHKIVVFLMPLFYSTFSHGMIWIFTLRFYLMFYDLNWNKSNINKKWKTHLNPHLIQTDFWLKHRSTFGRLSSIKLKYIFFTLVFLTSMTSLVLLQIWRYNPVMHKVALYIDATLYWIPSILCIILACKAPKILDVIYIKYEIKALITTLWVSLFIYYLVTSVRFFLKPQWISQLFMTNAASIIYVNVSFVSTVHILHKIKPTQQLPIESHHYNNDTNTTESLNIINIKHLSLINILNHKIWFEVFVQHLCREFSIELILSFVEFIQFKNYLQNMFPEIKSDSTVKKEEYAINEDEQEELMWFYNYNKCNLGGNISVPRSHIVYQLHSISANNERYRNINMFLQIAYSLYFKYIKTGQDLEINISGLMRSRYTAEMNDKDTFVQKFADIEPEYLFKYFDEIIEELFDLLTCSFNRFIETDQGENIKRMYIGTVEVELTES